jgi:glycerol-3-phosphate dehydrogenase
VAREDKGYRLHAGGRDFRARWVINAAGLYSDQIDQMFGPRRFTVRPRKGELIVFDKLSRDLLRHILLPVPTATTKGVLVSPTVFGNVLLGPTAEDLEDKRDTATSENGIAALWQKGHAILPKLLEEEVTATYAGLRAATEHSDYQLHVEAGKQYVCVGGIRSTGLTASMAIAEHVANALADAGLKMQPKDRFAPVCVPPLGRLQQRPFESAEAIARNPDYGRIVCHCERVSRGEILDALRSPVPARNLDGLRRRTRCLQGRCQGFYCLPHLAALFAEHTGVPISSLLSGEVRP